MIQEKEKDLEGVNTVHIEFSREKLLQRETPKNDLIECREKAGFTPSSHEKAEAGNGRLRRVSTKITTVLKSCRASSQYNKDRRRDCVLEKSYTTFSRESQSRVFPAD